MVGDEKLGEALDALAEKVVDEIDVACRELSLRYPGQIGHIMSGPCWCTGPDGLPLSHDLVEDGDKRRK